MHGSAERFEIEDFLRHLAVRLSDPLPGIDSHIRMAPSHRLAPEHLSVMSGRGVESAVSILLYPGIERLSVLLTRRPANMAAHPGQVSLPGGRRDEGETLEETARRELQEEVGIPRSIPERIGELSPLYIPPTDFNVFPFVFACDTRPKFVPFPREVEALIEVELMTLLDPSIRRSEIRQIRGVEAETPYFAIGEHKVWGATAMILEEFLEVARECIDRL